jgi:hypothetical protein
MISRDALHIGIEDMLEFRTARLLLLLNVSSDMAQGRPLDVERIAYYDFFSSHPFLVFGEGAPERLRLALAGFASHSLSYNSAPQRFTNRLARMQHDLTYLVSVGLVEVAAVHSRVAYRLTSSGSESATAFRALYARSFQSAAELVIHRLKGLSDLQLSKQATVWLGQNTLLMPILEDAR